MLLKMMSQKQNAFVKKNLQMNFVNIALQFVINFRVHKICGEKLPDFIVQKVPLDKYLSQIDCDPFFHFDKDHN